MVVELNTIGKRKHVCISMTGITMSDKQAFRMFSHRPLSLMALVPKVRVSFLHFTVSLGHLTQFTKASWVHKHRFGQLEV